MLKAYYFRILDQHEHKFFTDTTATTFSQSKIPVGEVFQFTIWKSTVLSYQKIWLVRNTISLGLNWKIWSKQWPFAFFTHPGENRSSSERLQFYDELREGYKTYSKKFNIFLLGDSNVRLGSFSQDKNINGQYVSNNNKANFLGFLEYTGLIYLNAIFAKGQPTYEIINRKKSIIDVALTNNIKLLWE